MSERTVRRCGQPIRWEFRCPRSWEALTPTADPNVRHCGGCKEDVHFCADDAATLEHARAGHCIARVEPSQAELPRLVVGRPEPELEPTREQLDALERYGRERGIRDALRAIQTTTRMCPMCHYPAPTFRDHCYVCRHRLVDR